MCRVDLTPPTTALDLLREAMEDLEQRSLGTPYGPRRDRTYRLIENIRVLLDGQPAAHDRPTPMGEDFHAMALERGYVPNGEPIRLKVQIHHLRAVLRRLLAHCVGATPASREAMDDAYAALSSGPDRPVPDDAVIERAAEAAYLARYGFGGVWTHLRPGHRDKWRQVARAAVAAALDTPKETR